MNTGQRGFFDYEQRLQAIDQKDALRRLDKTINWEAFRKPILKAWQKYRRGAGGRPRFDGVMMFKVLVLQRLYDLSDAQTEYQINDRISFMCFVGADMNERVPDEKTIWRFKEELREAQVLPKLWKIYEQQLVRLGIETGSGKIVDASVVENSRSRHKPPAEGQSSGDGEHEPPSAEAEPQQAVARQRQTDHDAQWVKKGNRCLHGYKNTIKVDADSKLIEAYHVETANVHDSKLLKHVLGNQDEGKQIHADKGYAGTRCHQEIEAGVAAGATTSRRDGASSTIPQGAYLWNRSSLGLRNGLWQSPQALPRFFTCAPMAAMSPPEAMSASLAPSSWSASAAATNLSQSCQTSGLESVRPSVISFSNDSAITALMREMSPACTPI